MLTCVAERANWPIQQHWNRLIALSVAWSGVNPQVSSQWKGDAKLMAAISKGLDYWFSNDYKQPDCVGDGGDPYVYLVVEYPISMDANFA